MNSYAKSRINKQIANVASLKDKLCLAQIELNKDKYKEISGMVMHDGEYITQAELTYLQKPTKSNWMKAMKSLNQNFVLAAGRN